MVITEIKLVPRFDISTPFYNEQDPLPEVFVAVSNQTRQMVEAGLISPVTSTVSADGHMQTNTRSFYSLEAYSTVDSLFGIDVEHSFMIHAGDATELFGEQRQYTQTGIDQPFSCTTTYAYPENVLELYPLFNSFINVIEYSNKLEDFANTGSALIATHHYENSEDFSVNHWYDARYLEGMFLGRLVRTISYALL